MLQAEYDVSHSLMDGISTSLCWPIGVLDLLYDYSKCFRFVFQLLNVLFVSFDVRNEVFDADSKSPYRRDNGYRASYERPSVRPAPCE